MVEIENKYRVSDWTALRATLAAWGASGDAVRRDTDHYFNAPDRDFAETDEAFRIRRIGTKNLLTYKGPKRDSSVKIRTEHEVEIAAGAENAATMVKILAGLGYRPVAVVAKSREVFHFTRHGLTWEACLDDVGAVGKFVEIETLAEENAVNAARTLLLQVAAELGLDAPEKNSYLQLLLNQPRAGS